MNTILRQEKRRLVLVHGMSGSGKTSLTTRLAQEYPDLVTVVSQDTHLITDPSAVPHVNGNPNWEHPDAADHGALYGDLKRLLSGQAITVQHDKIIYQPEHKGDVDESEVILEPKDIIVAEGYLVSYDERIRDLADEIIYLEMPPELAIKRRNKRLTPGYNEDILLPSIKDFILPLRKFANHTINTHTQTLDESYVELVKYILG